jgi:hypothetical protein
LARNSHMKRDRMIATGVPWPCLSHSPSFENRD